MKKHLILLSLLLPTMPCKINANSINILGEGITVIGTVAMAYADNQASQLEQDEQKRKLVAQQESINLLKAQKAPLEVLKELGLADTDENLYPTPLKRAKMIEEGGSDLLDAQDNVVQNLKQQAEEQELAAQEKRKQEEASVYEEENNEEEAFDAREKITPITFVPKPIIKEELPEETDRRKVALLAAYKRVQERTDSAIKHFENSSPQQTTGRTAKDWKKISLVGFVTTAAARASVGCRKGNESFIVIKIAATHLLTGGYTGASTPATLWGMAKSLIAEFAGTGINTTFQS